MCCTFLIFLPVIVAAVALCWGRAAFGGRALGRASRRPPPRAARSCCACLRTAAMASPRPEIRRAPCSPTSWSSSCTRSVLSVVACRFLPRSAAVSAGPARCGRSPPPPQPEVGPMTAAARGTGGERRAAASARRPGPVRSGRLAVARSHASRPGRLRSSGPLEPRVLDWPKSPWLEVIFAFTRETWMSMTAVGV